MTKGRYDCGNKDLTALMEMLADLRRWDVVSDAWFNAAADHVARLVPVVRGEIPPAHKDPNMVLREWGKRLKRGEW